MNNLRLSLVPSALLLVLATGCDEPSTSGSEGGITTTGDTGQTTTEPEPTTGDTGQTTTEPTTGDTGPTTNEPEPTTGEPDDPCTPSGGPVDLDLEFNYPGADDPALIELTDVPCQIEADGSFSCEIDGAVESLTVTLMGAGPMPWAATDSVVLTLRRIDGPGNGDRVVKVQTPEGQLLLVAVVGHNFPPATTIAPLALSIDDSVCIGDPEVKPIGLIYTLNGARGGQELSLSGDAESSLEVDGATYRIVQEEPLEVAFEFGPFDLRTAMILEP